MFLGAAVAVVMGPSTEEGDDKEQVLQRQKIAAPIEKASDFSHCWTVISQNDLFLHLRWLPTMNQI